MVKTPSKSKEELNKQVEKVLEEFEKMSIEDKEDFLDRVSKKFNLKGK